MLIFIEHALTKVAKTISRIEINELQLIFTLEIDDFSTDIQLYLFDFCTGKREKDVPADEFVVPVCEVFSDLRDEWCGNDIRVCLIVECAKLCYLSGGCCGNFTLFYSDHFVRQRIIPNQNRTVLIGSKD